MIDQWIQQLNASDPDQRREAIIALGRSKDPEALRYLSAIFRTDPEPELRELARKAGVYIQQQRERSAAPPVIPPRPPDLPSTGDLLGDAPPIASGDSAVRRRSVIRDIQTGATPDALTADSEPARLSTLAQTRAPERGLPPIIPTLSSMDDDDADGLRETMAEAAQEKKADRGPVRGREYNVSKANRTSARSLVDGAMTLSLNGEEAKALKALTQALRTDPNLINDNYFNSLASTITGKDGDAAIQVIVDGEQRSQAMKVAKQEKQQRRVEKHMEVVKTSTGRSVGFEMLIYILTVVLGPVAVMLVFIQTSLRFFEQFVGMTGDPTVEAEVANFLREGAEALSFGGVTIYFITALVSAAIGLIGLMIQLGVVHYVARLLGGQGTFNHLMATLLGFYNKWLPIFFVALCVVAGLFFVLFPSPIMVCFTIPIFLLIIYINFKTFAKIGEAYDIGLPMGCVVYLIASFAVSAVGSVVSAIIGSAMANVFSSLLQTPT